MADLTALDPQLDADAATCRAVVECPKGGRIKYAYDPRIRAFELKRVLPDGMAFPLDFGFVPSTVGGDGDPLDILILNDDPAQVGGVLTARLIGVIEAEQTEKDADGRPQTFRNDRLLAVAQISHLFAHVRTAEDLGEPYLKTLVEFWINYGALRGATFRSLGVKDAAAALEVIRSHRR
jgi:inorganic pyrophosphatase